MIAVVSEGRKDVATSEGQKLVGSSSFFPVRKAHIKERLERAKQLLAEKDFPEFGELIEAEALELHAIMLTSRPSLIYWTPGTLTIMRLTKKWRTEGIPVYFTVNTGQDIHLICERENLERVKSKLADVDGVKEVIVNFPAVGARISDGHLF